MGQIPPPPPPRFNFELPPSIVIGEVRWFPRRKRRTVEELLDEMIDMLDEALDFDPLNKLYIPQPKSSRGDPFVGQWRFYRLPTNNTGTR